MKEQIKKHRKKLQQLYNTKPMSPHPHPDLNHIPPPNPHLSHPPMIYNNSTMDLEFLVQKRQSNKCKSVRNDEIFNLHLASGMGP